MADFAHMKKLLGRENYHTWIVAMKAYLEHEDLWCAIEGIGEAAITTDAAKLRKARSKLILGIDEDLYSHFDGDDAASVIWTKLKAAFDDKGIMRGVSLLIEIVSIKLDDCKTTDEYVRRIITIANKLKGTKVQLPDHLIAAIMLAGLPKEYKPMVMSLESSNVDVTTDLVKSKILQEVQGPENLNETSGFFTYTSYPQRGRGRFPYQRGRGRGNSNRANRQRPR